jgi:hypothetical protein
MEQQIRAYVDELFAETVPSRKSVELKEEMIQNLTEKYNDLIARGQNAGGRLHIAIAGIGDISYLLKDLEKEGRTRSVGLAAPEDRHVHGDRSLAVYRQRRASDSPRVACASGRARTLSGGLHVCLIALATAFSSTTA